LLPRTRAYCCPACGWQGCLEPLEPDDAAPCPGCGVFLAPLTWLQTWGFALLVMAACAGVVALGTFVLR